MMATIIDFKKQAKQVFNFEEYVSHINELFEKNKVTGNVQNQAKLDATKINLVRINRLIKTYKVSDELQNKLEKLSNPMDWYLFSEGWCGDSAQSLPLINEIAGSSKYIYLHIILRDDNPELMNEYLTNGSASVPKLVAFDRASGQELFTWGARPKAIEEMVLDYKKKYTLNNKEEFIKNLHLWYARDKGKALEDDFINLLS